MIHVKNLYKSFNSHKVLEDISFRVDTGESIVIIGPSGCGKSVLLKHLIGLIKPDKGEVIVDDIGIHDLSERELLPVRRKFGMLFQNAALFDSMTVAENVGFVFHHEGTMQKTDIDLKITEALKMVGLEGNENKKPAELSGGMRKRVGLARAIIYRPEIILYDEPTTGLDPIVADSIDKLILHIRNELKVTTVVVTHDMRSARRLGNRLILLHNGTIHKTGKPEEFFESTDSVVHSFVNGISSTQN
ncbi:MAG: ATP-binding cassette domain-containing protein [Verrucomicrobia bacterium]|nr:ATP-binding cassette domain-containing protein [Verrucomicrobiota bacterium]MCF7709137.1 ATP-binding cassette domain-containing protein [Verrucomicrobiota bacterium]